VIEEYPLEPGDDSRASFDAAEGDAADVAIVLSARTEESLKELARQLRAQVELFDYSATDLVAVAYTLQTGRDAMEYRLAVIANGSERIVERLNAFINGDNHRDLFAVRGKQAKRIQPPFADDEDTGSLLERWIQKGSIRKLAQDGRVD